MKQTIKNQLSEKRSDAALAIAEVAQRRFPNNAEIGFLCGNIYLAKEKIKEAENAYINAFKNDENVCGLPTALAEIQFFQTTQFDVLEMTSERRRQTIRAREVDPANAPEMGFVPPARDEFSKHRLVKPSVAVVEQSVDADAGSHELGWHHRLASSEDPGISPSWNSGGTAALRTVDARAPCARPSPPDCGR